MTLDKSPIHMEYLFALIKWFTDCDLRHSHASLLIKQGFDDLTIAERLGHEKVSTTLNTFSHLFPHKQGELVQNLQDLLNPKSTMQTNGLQTTNTEETSRKIIPMAIRHII